MEICLSYRGCTVAIMDRFLRILLLSKSFFPGLDYQPLFGKLARVPPLNRLFSSLLGEGRESGGKRAYYFPYSPISPWTSTPTPPPAPSSLFPTVPSYSITT